MQWPSAPRISAFVPAANFLRQDAVPKRDLRQDSLVISLAKFDTRQ
jgi:hypothetical protein